MAEHILTEIGAEKMRRSIIDKVIVGLIITAIGSTFGTAAWLFQMPQRIEAQNESKYVRKDVYMENMRRLDEKVTDMNDMMKFMYRKMGGVK
jgi:hypothetical protein